MFLPMTARASVGARTEFGSSRWIDRWLAACRDLAELERSNPMTDAVVEEIDGRMIRIGDQWLADFASCNYLGFDLDREIIDSVQPALDRWGTHPSWSRLERKSTRLNSSHRTSAYAVFCTKKKKL